MCPFGLRGGKWPPDSTGRGGDRVSYRRHLADCRWPAFREGSQMPAVSAVPSPCLGEIQLRVSGNQGRVRAFWSCLSVCPRRTPRAGPWPFTELGPRGRAELWGLPGTRADGQPPGRKDRGCVPSGRQSLPKRRGRRPGWQPRSCRGTLPGCLLAGQAELASAPPTALTQPVFLLYHGLPQPI